MRDEVLVREYLEVYDRAVIPVIFMSKIAQNKCYVSYYIVMRKSLYFINPKFQTCRHFRWLYMLVCVGTGYPNAKFSHVEAHIIK